MYLASKCEQNQSANYAWRVGVVPLPSASSILPYHESSTFRLLIFWPRVELNHLFDKYSKKEVSWKLSVAFLMISVLFQIFCFKRTTSKNHDITRKVYF